MNRFLFLPLILCLFSCNITSKENLIVGRYEERIINFPQAYYYEKLFKHKFIVIDFNLTLEEDSTFFWGYCERGVHSRGKWINTKDSVVLFDIKMAHGTSKIERLSIPKYDRFILWPICHDSLCSKFSYVMLEKVK